MKLIKAAVFVMSGLLLMIFIFSLFIPSRVMTVRAVEMFSTRDKVFAVIGDFKQWKRWHPVFAADSSAMQISSPSTGVGAYAKWTTNGKENQLKITGLDSQSIKMVLSRPGELPVENMLAILPTAESSGYQVEWRVLTQLKWYPWEKFAGMFVDKVAGPGYEAALHNLKKELEQH